MRITFVGHASIFIEINGISILSDPWWRGPCFGAQWWLYPAPCLAPFNNKSVDYIYISHGHHDHFHPATLKQFAPHSRILVSKAINLTADIRKLGFEVIELPDDESETQLGTGVGVRIRRTHGADTLFCVTDGKETLVNLNDSLHSAPMAIQLQFVEFLRRSYGTVDYIFCGYGVASHFPNCYIVPDKRRELTAARRQQYFNRQWAYLIAALAPRFAFPFAADVVFLESDLDWVNEPTHNTERPVDVFEAQYPDLTTKAIDIAPGFSIDSGMVLDEVIRKPIQNATVLNELAEQRLRANRYGVGSLSEVETVLELLQRRLQICHDYLAEFHGDYRILIQMRSEVNSIEISKAGTHIAVTIPSPGKSTPSTYDLIYTTRLAYLKNALTTPYGHEILFVGSGGIFRYESRAAAQRAIHAELIVIFRGGETAPKSRLGNQPYYLFKLKVFAKWLLRVKRDKDLYDLDAWTDYS